MKDPTTGALRWTRSAAMTTVILGLAATAHVLAGGTLPSPLILAALAVATTCLTHTATRRRLRTPAVLALLGSGELLLHLAFETFATTSTLTPVAGHEHSAAQMAAQLAGATPVDAMTSDNSATLLSSMFVAHALATLLSGLALARGEQALWSLLAWLTPLVRVLRSPQIPVTPRIRLRRTDTTRWTPRALLLARDVTRRGPPALPART